MIAIIAAVSQNWVIGHKNRIPWDLPDDRMHFRRLTWGHTIVLGRRTHESIGRVLPGRRTIVLSRTVSSLPGVEVAAGLADALLMAAGDDIFVCGGAEVYAEALPHADRLFLTMVQVEVQGDTYFPAIPPDFVEIGRRSEQQPIPHDFLELIRCSG